MNAVVTTSPADQFRAKASGLFVEAAEMTLHQLVDEFQRLTKVMDDNIINELGEGRKFNETAELASRERRVVTSAARARFGISFDAYDRQSGDGGYYDF